MAVNVLRMEHCFCFFDELCVSCRPAGSRLRELIQSYVFMLFQHEVKDRGLFSTSLHVSFKYTPLLIFSYK